MPEGTREGAEDDAPRRPRATGAGRQFTTPVEPDGDRDPNSLLCNCIWWLVDDVLVTLDRGAATSRSLRSAWLGLRLTGRHTGLRATKTTV